MLVSLTLEASQPGGTTYRIGIGCLVDPKLVTTLIVLMRLF